MLSIVIVCRYVQESFVVLGQMRIGEDEHICKDEHICIFTFKQVSFCTIFRQWINR